MKNEVIDVFRHINGLASRVIDANGEGLIFSGCLSSSQFNPEWAIEFKLSKVISSENLPRPLIICDDYKRKILRAVDIFNPHFDGQLGFIEMTDDFWDTFKNCVKGIYHKYFFNGLGSVSNDEKISPEFVEQFIDEVYSKECDRMIEYFEKHKNHFGHTIISISNPEFNEYMSKRFTDAGYSVEISKDGYYIWVVINNALEILYKPMDEMLNHNFGHNDR